MKAQKYQLPIEFMNLMMDRHGLFQFSDAQGDVSKAFASDVIEEWERIRSAAPEMLAALKATQSKLYGGASKEEMLSLTTVVDAAITKAEGRES